MRKMPKIQQLTVILNGIESGVSSSLDRIEILTETLRAMFPEFAKEHTKQVVALRRRRAAQKRDSGALPNELKRPVVALLQDVFERRTR
jgi:hypothetical protein